VLKYLETFWNTEPIEVKDKTKLKVVLWESWEVEFSKNDHEFLFEIWVFNLMKKKFIGEWNIYITDKKTGEILKDENTWKNLTIFDNWNGWLGYFTKFFETRKNLYKSDGTSTALATRIIDQNLKRFCDNLEIFEWIKKKIDFSNLEKDFQISLNDFFSLWAYNSHILQEWIQKYNDIIWWKIVENNKKIPWINEYINKYRQDTWEKISFLSKLDKQILSESKEVFIKQIENDINFEEILRKFHEDSVKNVEILSYLFLNLWNYDDYKTIYFSKEAFNTIVHKFSDNVLLFEKLVFDELLNDKLVEKKDFDKKE
jgi:CRISPR-associated protein Cpf1